MKSFLDGPDDFPEGRGIGCVMIILAILIIAALITIAVMFIKSGGGQV